MTLANLTTPFERRRMIEYGADGCKVVRHWYNVQHVSGPLYKGEDHANEYGEPEFELFIFFPGADTGLLYQRMRHPDWFTAEKLMASVEREHFDSLEHMIAEFDSRMENDQFIGNAQIEFIRQFNQQRAARYAQYRLEYYARREEKERQKHLAEQAEEAKKAAAQKAELAAEKAKYLGWANDMTPLRFGQVTAFMDTRIRVDGAVMTKREFIINSIKDGWIPEKEEGVVSWYGSRWNAKKTKPRTEYRLCKGNCAYKITKTEYDFAMYLTTQNTAEHQP